MNDLGLESTTPKLAERLHTMPGERTDLLCDFIFRWVDLDGRALFTLTCTEEAVAQVTVGCTHEHFDTRKVCTDHLSQIKLEDADPTVDDFCCLQCQARVKVAKIEPL